MLAARGSALLLAGDESVSVSYESGFTDLGQGDFFDLPDSGADRGRRLYRRRDAC